MKFLRENINNIYHAYHGSRSDFNKFNQDFIGAHALEHGYGFYFTSDEEQAKSYGDYLIEADLIIRNPFSTEDITITQYQVKQYIRKYIDPTGENYLSNYGWYKDIGYEKVLNNCIENLFSYNLSDNDILSEILPWVENKFTDEAYDAIFDIFGKDGIIYKGYSESDGEPVTNYIVYSNSQITNKKKRKINKEINESKINNTPVLIPNKEDNIELYNKLDLSTFKSNIRCIRDNCGPIVWDLYDYLEKEGYEPKIIRGEFKTDNLNLLDKNDLTKEERSLYKALYSDKFTNEMIIEFINDQIPDLINDFYYLPHTWIKLDGLILDPSYRMFNKGLDKPITKYNYIEGRNGNI